MDLEELKFFKKARTTEDMMALNIRWLTIIRRQNYFCKSSVERLVIAPDAQTGI